MNQAVLAPPAPESVHDALRTRTAAVEERVRDAYAQTIEPRFASGIALAAVGGFGRRELFPCSDVDLLLLVEFEQQIPPAREAISGFLKVLWDAGMRPSHSVHTVNDCAAPQDDNVELTISLLDRRRVAGDPAMFDWLDQRFRKFLEKRGTEVARQLAALAESRHSRYQHTIYHLEPNLKDTPGGLRDLQTVRWLAGLERTSAPDFAGEFDFLAALRIRLHELAGRDQNVLNFDAQESMSEHPATLMRGYFQRARRIDRLVRTALAAAAQPDGTLLGRFHEWRSRLSTNEFTVSRDRVLLRVPPGAIPGLTLFEFVARHDLRLAPDAIARLDGFTPTTNWEDWRRLLALPRAARGLRAMQEAGTLAAALPEWRAVECLVVRDFYHRYTVDEHTLVAIDALESVTDARFAGLLAEIEEPALLRFALLLHDSGKGSGHDHVQASLELARGVLARLGAPEADRLAVEFLVENHLALSQVMTSRDLHDTATALALAARVGTIERLKLLVMLTYADISAVNPQAMTPWRLEQLWRVYLLAHEELTRELETERIHGAAGVSPERAAFLEGLPTRYVRTHSESEIDGHVALARQLETRPLAIEIVHERSVYRLSLLARDRAGLFAAVAGALSSFGMNILKAEAFSNAHGVVVDTFTFADPHRTLELNPSEVDRLRGIVRKVVEGKQDVEKLLRARPRPVLASPGARLEPRVAFSNDASEAATLIEIVAEDRPGLLYDLAHAISDSGCNIEVVLIDTEAHKALDVFYVTADGRKLDAALKDRLRDALVEACAAR